MAALIAFLTSSATLAKIALGLINLANSILGYVKEADLKDQGYQQAVAESTAKTLDSVGITAAAFGRVAGWTDEQVITDLTAPPSPRP